MIKLCLLLLCALSLACVSPTQKAANSFDNYVIPLDSIWNLYVFDIDRDQSLGRAFIANNFIWSAKHIFTDIDLGACDDVANLGHTNIHGLDLCNREHKINDLLYFRSKVGIKYYLIVSVEKEFYKVISLSPIIQGESGSPVMCISDGSVVGLVSHMLESETEVSIGGQISRIHLSNYE